MRDEKTGRREGGRDAPAVGVAGAGDDVALLRRAHPRRVRRDHPRAERRGQPRCFASDLSTSASVGDVIAREYEEETDVAVAEDADGLPAELLDEHRPAPELAVRPPPALVLPVPSAVHA